MTRLRTNFKYLVEIVAPHGLKLSFLKNLELTSKAFMNKYLEVGFHWHLMENFVVQQYNAEVNVASMVEWDIETDQYKLKTTLKPLIEVEAQTCHRG